MHEFVVGETLVKAILSEVRRVRPAGVRVRKAKILVGGLRQIVPDYLQTAYAALTRNTIAEDSVLEIRRIPPAGKCASCGWSGSFSQNDFRCRTCGSMDVTLEGGIDLCLESIEIDDTVEDPITTSARA